MQYQPSRKTWVPSNRKCHQGGIAIVGRLVILSVFMLVFGVTRATAQTGQDPRCSEFRGQAHGLCTAAISEGCFDPGVESQACDDLTTNWNERCRVCEGTAPWAVTCPCAPPSAVQLNALFEMQQFTGQPETSSCDNELGLTQILRIDSADALPQMFADARFTFGLKRCLYRVAEATGVVILENHVDPITEVEYEACRADILVLQDQFPDACP